MQMSAANLWVKILKQDSFNLRDKKINKNNMISKAGNFEPPNCILALLVAAKNLKAPHLAMEHWIIVPLQRQ